MHARNQKLRGSPRQKYLFVDRKKIHLSVNDSDSILSLLLHWLLIFKIISFEKHFRGNKFYFYLKCFYKFFKYFSYVNSP